MGPYKVGATEIIQKVREVFRSPLIEVIPYTLDTSYLYADIRVKQGVTPADAIHLACAAPAHFDLFLTNDTALVGKVVPGIQFIAGLDSNVL